MIMLDFADRTEAPTGSPGGSSGNKKAAQAARHQGVSKMFGVGEMGCVASEEFGKAGHCFEKIDEMAEAILGQIHEGVNLLVKGSRSAGMDRLVEHLMSNNNRGETNHAI